MSNNTQDTIEIQGAEELPENPQSFYDGFVGLIPMIGVFLVFYFFLLRPQEKKRKAQEDLTSSVKKGESIITSSGIFGRITKINDSDNSVYLEVSESVEIKITKSSIADILSRNDENKSKNSNKIISKKDNKKKNS